MNYITKQIIITELLTMKIMVLFKLVFFSPGGKCIIQKKQKKVFLYRFQKGMLPKHLLEWIDCVMNSSEKCSFFASLMLL